MWTYAVNYNTDNDIYFEKLSYNPNTIAEEIFMNSLEEVNVSVNHSEKALFLEFLKEHGSISIELYNISGQKIWSDHIYINEAGERQYDLSDLSSSCYFLKVIYGDNSSSEKIILVD